VPARVALITGAARGIGRAVAAELIAAGDRVVIADINEVEATRAAGELNGSGNGEPQAVAIHLDVTDPASVDRAVTQAEEQVGPIGVLVNNAGWDELMPFLKTDEAFWDRVIEINFKGCLRVSRRVVPGMVERTYGRVINIGSDAGRVGSSLEAVYSGAKGGVVAFTKTLARETARSGVTANAVCPGPTDTPLLANMLDLGEQTAGTIEAMTRAVPMRRLGTPEDVAIAVAFFASDRAGYITGQTLSVSGGLTMA
jgi:2-hydroxycyclohexanecarboxyl-CoA dehydrogenase